MKKPYKIVVVYHDADLDGKTSALVANKIYQQLFDRINIDVTLIGYNYQPTFEYPELDDPLNNDIDYIQFVDVTPPIDWLMEYVRKVRIDIFDHHQPKFDEIEKNFLSLSVTNFNYYFDANICGAKIYNDAAMVWVEELLKICNKSNSWFKRSNTDKKFIEELQLFDSEFLDLVTSYDTWQWYNQQPTKNWNAFYLNEGFNARPFNVENKYHLPDLISEGITIARFQKQNKPKLNTILDFVGNKVVVFNSKYNFFLVEQAQAEGYDAVLFWRYESGVKCSIRSFGTGLAYKIAKELDQSGGGHADASGSNFEHIEQLFDFFKSYPNE